MDFMEKISEKLNAQKIIGANTGAEMEELEELKERLKEYDECLKQMSEAGKELEDGYHKVEERLMELSNAAIRRINDVGLEPEQIDALLTESFEKVWESGKDERESSDKLSEELEKHFTDSEDYIHKEDVKVYRNVQAVVEEQSGKEIAEIAKLSEKLDDISTETGIVKNTIRPVKGILVVSILALACSAVSLTVTVLANFFPNVLHVLGF